MLLVFQPHKSAHTPEDIKNYETGVVSNGITLISNFIMISQLIKKCTRVTHTEHGDFISLLFPLRMKYRLKSFTDLTKGMFDKKTTPDSIISIPTIPYCVPSYFNTSHVQMIMQLYLA
jgi:hypothetical protein